MAEVTDMTQEFVDRVNEKFSIENPDKEFELTAEAGRKYDKVIINDENAFVFIERSTGNIFKPASFKAPHTKYVRYEGKDMDQAIEDADPYGSFLYIR